MLLTIIITILTQLTTQKHNTNHRFLSQNNHNGFQELDGVSSDTENKVHPFRLMN